MSIETNGLSRATSDQGKLQRALLQRLHVHEREGTLPTSARFLFYELVQAGVVSKHATGVRRADQNLIDALTHLREVGAIPWDWIEDETRTLHSFRTAPTVAEYVAEAVDYASLDRWAGKPAPLILCESRSLAGVLHDLAGTYACPIAATNGQCRGFLVSKVAPRLQAGQRVLYLGDWDRGGHQIEAANKATLIEHTIWWGVVARTGHVGIWEKLGLWERVALTAEQVNDPDNPLPVIQKLDGRYNDPVTGKKVGRYFDAVETEAFGQANIVAALRARLDELMPEPIADVHERERRQREQVADLLRTAMDE